MSGMPTREELMALSPEYLAENHGYRLTNTSIAFIVLTTVIYGLFIISRMFFVRRNGWEIWSLYPLGYLSSLALAIKCILSVRIGGCGRHMAYWFINDSSVITTFLKLQTGMEFTYMFGITVPKACILVLYLNIFTNRRARIITWAVLGVIIAHFIASGIITYFVICQPFAFKWNKSIPGGHCADLQAAYKYVSIPNILTDLAIVGLPISTLRSLQVNRAQRIGIFATFLLGGLGIVAAIIRLVGFYMTDLEKDLTFLGLNTLIYTLVEPNAYFICSCLPSIRPLLIAMFRNLRQTSVTSSHEPMTGSRPKYHQRLDYSGTGRSGQTISVSASKGWSRHSDDQADCIRLHETIQVDTSSR